MTLRQTDIATALGLSPSAVTRLKARGMPTDSIEAARLWRDANVRPRMPAVSAQMHRAVDTSARCQAANTVDQVNRLGLATRAALGTTLVVEAGLQLRRAMRALPRDQRHLVRLDVDVWDLLLRPAMDELGDAPSHAEASDAEESDDPEAESIWYGLACGELMILPPGMRALAGDQADDEDRG